MGRLNKFDKDSKYCYVFVDGLNAHHQDWLDSRSMDSHGDATCIFINFASCVQL